MKRLFFFIFLLLCVCPSQAQITTGEQEQRRLQQQTQDMLRQREIEMQERSFHETAPKEGAAISAGEEDGHCLDIESINISGAKKISLKKINKRLETIKKPCFNKNVLQEIQNAVQQMYLDGGYISSRVYFDFTALNERRLNIIISEGILEEIILLDPKTKEPLSGAAYKLGKLSAFPFMEGKILNLRDLEQGVEQMNKLASNSATMQIRPGKEEGKSSVIIDNGVLPKNNLALSFDNSGSESSGKYKGGVSYSRDNLFLLNENIYLNASSTIGESRDRRYSRSVLGSINIPFGYWSVSESLSYSKYLSTTRGVSGDIETNGNSLTNTISLERMFIRGRNYKVAGGLQYVFKENKNYVMDTYIDTSSRILSTGSLYLNGTYYVGAGALFSKLSLNRGLDILGAKKDITGQKGAPQAQFTSLSLFANYSRNISLFAYSASLDSQYGFDDMFSSEQFLIGGGTTRGFKENSAYGEAGFSVKQDLRLMLGNVFRKEPKTLLDRLVNNAYVGVFADYGFVRPKTYGGSKSIAGAGAKAGYYGKYLSGEFAWARSLFHPEEVPSEGNVFYFNMSLKILF